MDSTHRTPQLEPLRFGELLDAGFRLWRKGFKELFIVAAVITVSISLITYFLQSQQVVAIGPAGQLIVEDVNRYNSLAWILVALSWGASFLSSGAVLVITTRAYIGSVPRWRDALRITLPRLLPFIGLALLSMFAIGVAAIAFVIPGIIVGTALSFSWVAFWAEGAGVIDSMRRSWSLTRGRRWAILGLWIITFVLYTIVGTLLVIPFLSSSFTENVELYLFVNNVGQAVVGAVMAPLLSCLLTAAYYDARVRNEAFDIQLAVSMLESEDDQPPDSFIR